MSAPLVRYVKIARNTSAADGCCMFVPKRRTKPCRSVEQSKRHPHFGRNIRQEQASKGRSPKQCDGWTYDAHAMAELRKTQLQQVLTAVAIDIVRIDALLTQTPRGKTRRSSFMRLATHPCWDGQQAA